MWHILIQVTKFTHELSHGIYTTFMRLTVTEPHQLFDWVIVPHCISHIHCIHKIQYVHRSYIIIIMMPRKRYKNNNNNIPSPAVKHNLMIVKPKQMACIIVCYCLLCVCMYGRTMIKVNEALLKCKTHNGIPWRFAVACTSDNIINKEVVRM